MDCAILFVHFNNKKSWYLTKPSWKGRTPIHYDYYLISTQSFAKSQYCFICMWTGLIRRSDRISPYRVCTWTMHTCVWNLSDHYLASPAEGAVLLVRPPASLSVIPLAVQETLLSDGTICLRPWGGWKTATAEVTVLTIQTHNQRLLQSLERLLWPKNKDKKMQRYNITAINLNRTL